MARNRRISPKKNTVQHGRQLLAWISDIAWVERIQNYLFMHAHLFVASLGRIYRTPIASAVTVTVIAIALALPATFHAALDNMVKVSGNLEDSNQISVFLKPEIVNDVGSRISRKLAEHPQIQEAKLISKEAGLQEFRKYSGFGEALQALDYNPLPVVIAIKPKDSLTKPEEIDRLVAELKSIDEADFVQVDTAWIRKLSNLLSIAGRSVVVLDILLGVAVLFIVGNTIRLELQSRHEEIAVTKLMGATDGFVRRPFLYAGFWYGFAGGVAGWLIVTFVLLLLSGPVDRLAELYGSDFKLSFLSLDKTGLMLLISAAIGVGGAWAVVDFHLREIESQ
jgi:cell division transport system permease protein